MKIDPKGELMKLTKEQLIDYIGVLKKNFWTCQNNWMANVNKRYGTKAAAELDALLFGRLMLVEVHRFKKLFNLGDDLSALTKCMIFSISSEEGLESEWVELTAKRVSWQCTRCPMQLRRRSDGVDELPCKEPLISTATNLAAAVNPRIKVTHVFAPPDPHTDDLWCGATYELD